MPVDPPTAELAEAVAAAWRDAPYPGDRAISGDHDHEAEISRELTAIAWQQVDPAFVRRFSYDDGLDHLKPAALAYYLPAFLLVALIDPSTQDALARLLAPPAKRGREPWMLERFWGRVDLLSEGQKQVVARMFSYWRGRDWVSDEEWIDVLDYWKPYLAER